MYQKFGDRLRALRLEKHMSQEEFAALLGTSKQVISRYETNQRTPKITITNKYAKILNVSLNYLLGETDEQKNKPSIEVESLSKKERKLLAAFREMTVAEQEMLLRVAAVKETEIRKEDNQ